jgi:2-dehydropantoate 2-reductase
MGNAEAISRIVPAERVFIGLCFVCVMMNTPGVVEHLEKGNIQFAPALPTDSGLEQAQELAALFTGTPVQTACFRHAEQILWCKLSWNIPFNGLCLAHGGISIRQLFTMPQEVQRAGDIM